MNETKRKRPAAGTAERKTTKVAVRSDNYIVSQTFAACKRFLCLMGCLLAALATLLFFCAPFEPGDVSLTAGWTLAAISWWLCRELYEGAQR